MEFVLVHGVPSGDSVSCVALCDASTFVSQGGPPHRESSASSGGRRAAGARKGPQGVRKVVTDYLRPL
ncbi:hypothetical protein GT045_26260 [Streptomyces sp. SID486]|nr:hypothetical protein [Streptomyces sp. SID486]